MAQEWRRVTREFPCPVCLKPDWCCVSADGTAAWCMRVKSDKSKDTGAGVGYLHRLSNGNTHVPRLQRKPIHAQVKDWDRLADDYYRVGGPIRRRLAHSLRVSEHSLDQLRVGVGVNVWGWEYTTWPERLPTGKVSGIVIRYFDKKCMIRGSHHGLYFTDDWRKGTGPLLIVEGGSDVAACLTMGFQAVGRPSATGGLNLLMQLLEDYSGDIIVVGENDRKFQPDCSCRKGTVCMRCWPGLVGAQKTRKRIKACLPNKVRVMLPTGKDARDCLRSDKLTADFRNKIAELHEGCFK